MCIRIIIISKQGKRLLILVWCMSMEMDKVKLPTLIQHYSLLLIDFQLYIHPSILLATKPFVDLLTYLLTHPLISLYIHPFVCSSVSFGLNTTSISLSNTVIAIFRQF